MLNAMVLGSALLALSSYAAEPAISGISGGYGEPDDGRGSTAVG